MYSTAGVILKKISAGEADEFYVMYTKDFGKIKISARGIKKEGAKLRGHLELWGLSNISFVLGKSGARLTQARMLNFWPLLRKSSERLTVAGWMLETVDKNCEEAEKDESIWQLILESLNFLEEQNLQGPALDLFKQQFSKKLSIYLGYGGNLDNFR